MPKVELEVNELTDTKVSHISLVKRGANRIPFRLTKGEDQMWDLSRIFRKHESAPTVLAAVVRKGADLGKVKDRLTKAGLSVDNMKEQGDTVLFVQKEMSGVDEHVLKLDEDVALVVSGLAKAFEGLNLESTSFKEVFATEAFRPSIHMATDMLMNTVSNILSKAESPEFVVSELDGALSEFRKYVVGLAKALPVQAFKADVLEGEAQVEKTEEAKSQEDGGEAQTDSAKKADDDKAGEQDAKKADAGDAGKSDGKSDDGDADKEAEARKSDGEKADDDGQSDNEAKKDAAAGDRTAVDLQGVIKAAMDELRAGLTKEISGAMDGLRQEVAGLAKRVDQAEARSKKAEEAILGTVGGVSKGDDVVNGRGDVGGVPPLLDTAFDRRH